MKSTPRKIIGSSFQMLSKEARNQVLRYEHTVLCLMILTAICSIIWTISLLIISGDFSNSIISAKLAFRKREFENNRTKEIFYNDLQQIINDVYADDEHLLLTETELTTVTTNQTKKPKIHKIPHIYQKLINATKNSSDHSTPIGTENKPPDAPIIESTTTTTTTNQELNNIRRKRSYSYLDKEIEHFKTTSSDAEEVNSLEQSTLPKKYEKLQISTKKIKVIFDPKADREFLGNMTVDVHQTHWSIGTKAQFFYTFPFISEIVAIIWSAMCLIFQTETKKTWGLPKPWRIVVPSMAIFSLMFLGNLVYTITANSYLKHFCGDLRSHLTKPDAISCGQALTLLRPVIRQHSMPLEGYLQLFRSCYILSMVFWVLALVLMVLRYIFAIDFQLVDVDEIFEREIVKQPYSELPLGSPVHEHYSPKEQKQHHHQQQQQIQKDRSKKDRPKSEDDFQSAKSHLSEVGTPLLSLTTTTTMEPIVA